MHDTTPVLISLHAHPTPSLSCTGGFVGFDNVAQSMFVLFIVTTLEEWSMICAQTQQVTGYHSLWLFVLIIVIGSGVLMNLLVAALLMELDSAMHHADSSDPEEDAPSDLSRSWEMKKLKFWQRVDHAINYRGLHGTRFRDAVHDSVQDDTSLFNRCVAVVVVFNIGVLASSTYPAENHRLLETMNSACTWIFTAECVFKNIATGPLQYFYDPANCLDFFVVLTSLVEEIA